MIYHYGMTFEVEKTPLDTNAREICPFCKKSVNEGQSCRTPDGAGGCPLLHDVDCVCGKISDIHQFGDHSPLQRAMILKGD